MTDTKKSGTPDGLDDIWDDWNDAVNMTRKELSDWLATDESKSVGDSKDGESTGHEMGRRITDILDTKKSDLTDDDVKAMHKVVGYVHRHRAQGPSKDVEHSRWRYSLMNWGNDPLK
ncbi:DNA-binding protein [Rhodococcus sp. Leaf7]|uniref:DUF3140 domain-containing protein n=1 Tax=unclassified Rhodococcus (in: high G+C Gram-positive bacteria) TaxID=192944 RepID=UPI0006FB6901|nr:MULTISPECIES: DUF3140 domain-containing protein [unclassified Rhodococcus (in: high G+C Gram-positive bacteria)]KQU06577.1 DNA-binding protein [Rhodococcus sp. Leaf7]KQU42095.1 DNA-binding protein [Rhodococcus sp. Leaf247]